MCGGAGLRHLFPRTSSGIMCAPHFDKIIFPPLCGTAVTNVPPPRTPDVPDVHAAPPRPRCQRSKRTSTANPQTPQTPFPGGSTDPR